VTCFVLAVVLGKNYHREMGGVINNG